MSGVQLLSLNVPFPVRVVEWVFHFHA